ncbi:Tm-1-like ATP-binding domain-containing protein [Nonomuraea insulae]|uniref:Tm-1-like ATP-binding domain-containing protein n=1 Tax=Nonomuraea insulae TaxID=1616787 RepID=A0ABW1D8U1_9ACTN
MARVALIGTYDTKGSEYHFLRKTLETAGVDSLTVDAGVLTDSAGVDIGNAAVADAGGSSLQELRALNDRGRAVEVMAAGARKLVRDLVDQGVIQGVLGLGGTGGTTLVTTVMRALPIGFPKVMVSTVAAGDTRQYFGTSDITMMYSVVDIAGLNSVSLPILANAAGAIAGMVQVKATDAPSGRPVVAATMFGVTTPAVQTARARLESHGYEVLVFHATGVGGASMESLIESGMIAGVLDLTTTELADELVGGVFSAGSTRLTAAGRAGIPQVVSFGALDMVNFGPKDSVPAEFRERTLHVHNASVTLMRTTVDESRTLGRRIAERLNTAQGPVTAVIPLQGVSAIDMAGQPFHDPEADTALFGGFEANVSPRVTVVKRHAHINDPDLATEMADLLHQQILNSSGEQ